MQLDGNCEIVEAYHDDATKNAAIITGKRDPREY